MLDEEVVDQVVTDESDIYDTGSVPVPPAEADAHQATIEGVTKVTFDSGSTAIEIALRSADVPNLEMQLRVFPPKAFVEDIFCPKTDLDEGALFQYRTSIQNDDHSALLQTLAFNKAGESRNEKDKVEAKWDDSVARKNGRTAAGLGLVKPTNFDEYVGNLSKLLTGLEVVIVRRPGKGEYKSRLEVKTIYARDVIENPGKKFKNISRLMWVQQG